MRQPDMPCSRAATRGRTMDFKRVQKTLVIGALVLLLGATCVLGYCRWSIQSGLDTWCAIAQERHPHPGDDIAALLAYVQSDAHSLRDRNHGVWALGQARDSRALPVLKSYYTASECDHSRCLCQYELEKAIKLCQGQTPNPLHIRTPKTSNAGLQ